MDETKFLVFKNLCLFVVFSGGGSPGNVVVRGACEKSACDKTSSTNKGKLSQPFTESL